MSNYGIKLVWPGWKDDTVIGFSDRGAKRFGDGIQTGTRMLIYETATKRPGVTAKGTKSIVGAVEVDGSFEDGEKYRPPNEEHSRLLPVKVIHRRDDVRPIPLERVRKIIADENWPRMGEAWKALTDEQYQAFLKEWGVSE